MLQMNAKFFDTLRTFILTATLTTVIEPVIHDNIFEEIVAVLKCRHYKRVGL